MKGKILGIFVVTLLISISITEAEMIKKRNNIIENSKSNEELSFLELNNKCIYLLNSEVCKWGQEYDSKSGDVKHHGEHSIRMGEAAGGTDGTAWYYLNLGCNYGIKDDTFKVGIYFCDWGWFGDGPSVYLYNYNSGVWDRKIHEAGNNDQMQWQWSGTISNENDYINNGQIYVKVWAESDDDSVLEKVCARFECIGEPMIEWDPSSPYDFDNVKIYTTKHKDFKLWNMGDGTATGKVTISGDSTFKITYGSGDFSISSNDYKYVGVDFYPTEIKSYSANLKVINSNCNSPSVSLIGTGYEENNPPFSPVVLGPIRVCKDESKTWTSLSEDPENDNIYYKYDWGDGQESDWLGSYASGVPCLTSHSYSISGGKTYIITVKAKDEHGLESSSTQYPVVVGGKGRFSNILQFFNFFPFLLKI